ncbi:MAG: hypothetical protein IJR97_13220 [Clostridia bacterium]|nr:hypothetical protein [Clostridia bacterium]
MKKFLCVLFALTMVCGLAAAEVVDTYTSASLTKSFVEGEELDALAVTLSESGADIATKAQTEAEGYQRMYGSHVQIMSVNPDGSIGMSTIGYWRYVNNREGGMDAVITAGDWQFTKRGEGADQVVIQLTEGQNALNLYNAGVGSRTSLLVKLENTSYLLHLNTTDIHVQEFDQAAYDAGEFASGYSGADRQARSFYFTFDVLSIEKTNQLMF